VIWLQRNKYIYWNGKYKLGFSDIDADFILPKIIPDFITDNEAKYIIEEGSKNLQNSSVVSGVDLNVRKSQTNILNNNDPTIRQIIERACQLTNLPFKNVEPIQMLKYDSDGYYNQHYDSCPDENDHCRRFVETGGQRVATVIIYLNDDYTGGTTKFINLGEEFHPVKYSALLFYSMDKGQTKTHPLSLHAGMPLKNGTKYIANIWFREREYV
jgi:prolyl 4-hydroxylase